MNGEVREELAIVVDNLIEENQRLKGELQERDESRAELRDMYVKLKAKFESERAYQSMQEDAYNEA